MCLKFPGPSWTLQQTKDSIEVMLQIFSVLLAPSWARLGPMEPPGLKLCYLIIRSLSPWDPLKHPSLLTLVQASTLPQASSCNPNTGVNATDTRR